MEELTKSDKVWRQELTPEQYRVLREKGTERAFTGSYWEATESGIYCCAGCGSSLFRSDAKYDSGSGWPSFWESIDATHIELCPDVSLGTERAEVVCARCGGHLGHVFDDGPRPTRKHYCVNSASLELRKEPDHGHEKMDDS